MAGRPAVVAAGIAVGVLSLWTPFTLVLALVLATVPGSRWAEERGLTENHYIVPGGGGLGEVMNNSYV